MNTNLWRDFQICISVPLRKLTHILVCVTDKFFRNRKSFMWPNYFAIGKLFWNGNFKATIKVAAYIFLCWYLKKKNCKHKYHDIKVKSLKRQSTLGLLLKPGPGSLKTWTLKNMDPEKWNKYGIKKYVCL